MEREGEAGAAQQIFDFYSNDVFPEGDPFWQLRIGNPGPENLFDFAVYARGAMTLHQLRLKVGDRDFFTVLRRWAQENRNGLVTTPEFIALAEQVADRQLDRFFQRWLFTTTRPAVGAGLRVGAESRAGGRTSPPAVVRAQLRRLS